MQKKRRKASEDLGFSHGSNRINSKKKGDRNEVQLAKFLTKWSGSEFQRVPMSGGLHWKNKVDVCGDVINTDNDFDCPVYFETKAFKHISMRESLASNAAVNRIFLKAKAEAPAGKIPVLLIRVNGMPASTWMFYSTCYFKEATILSHGAFGTHELYGYNTENLRYLYTFDDFLNKLKY